jgi:hypothetical protein
VVPAGSTASTIALTLVNWPKEHPVSGLRVEVWPGEMKRPERAPPEHGPGETPLASGVTAADGRLDLVVPPGEPVRLELPRQGRQYELFGEIAPFEGKVFAIEPLRVGERREFRWQLLHGREFTSYGRAVAAEDGKPISGARVISTGGASNWDAEAMFASGPDNRSCWVEADSDGRFELRLTYEQQFGLSLAVVAPGRVPVRAAGGGSESLERPREFRLFKSGSVRGRIVQGDGSSKDNLSVWLGVMQQSLNTTTGQTWSGDLPVWWRSSCDAEGRFELQGLPVSVRLGVRVLRNEVELMRIARGSEEAPKLEPGECREVEWRLPFGAKVSGIAYDRDSNPVARHAIWLLKMPPFDWIVNPGPVAMLIGDDEESVVTRVVTDASGRFAFDAVAPGSWWVGIAPDPASLTQGTDTVVPVAIPLEVAPGAESLSVTLKPNNTRTIRGKVLNPDGSPAWMAMIVLAREGNDFGPESGVSAQDGTFTVLPAESGRWRVRALGGGEHVDSDEVEAAAGDEGLILKLKIGTTISGEVVCADCGQDAQLRISLLGDRIEWQTPRGYGSSRTFEFGGLPSGTYGVLAQCEPDRAGIVRGIHAEVGRDPGKVRVELTTGAVLVVRYSGKNERCNFRLFLDDLATGGEDVERNATRRIIVPPGIVKLRPDAGGAEHVLTVRAGTETEVVLDDN